VELFVVSRARVADQVWDKWPSGEVSRVGAARLPLDLITAKHRRSDGSREADGSGGGRAKNFRIPVELDPEAPEA